jgi:uncharacterized membrane protein YgcG
MKRHPARGKARRLSQTRHNLRLEELERRESPTDLLGMVGAAAVASVPLYAGPVVTRLEAEPVPSMDRVLARHEFSALQPRPWQRENKAESPERTRQASVPADETVAPTRSPTNSPLDGKQFFLTIGADSFADPFSDPLGQPKRRDAEPNAGGGTASPHDSPGVGSGEGGGSGGGGGQLVSRRWRRGRRSDQRTQWAESQF